MNDSTLTETPNRRRAEYATILLVLLALTALFSAAKLRDVAQFRGDTAIFFQATENIGQGLGARSQVFANTRAFQQSQIVTETAQQIASDPLAPPPLPDRNVLRFHAYYILYPLALLSRIFPVGVVLLSLCVLSFVGLLALAYAELRAAGVAVAAAIVFCLLVASHPAWYESLLWGQFFPDRFFLLIGFAFAIAITRNTPARALQLVLGLACLLVGERGALYAGGFGLLYMLAFRRESETDRTFKIAVSAVLLLAGILMLKFGITNDEYGGFLPGSLHQIAAMWQRPDFRANTALFVLVNVPLLLLAFFDYPAAIVAAILMLPNVLGNIGGSEKIGWSTHYHAYYLPVLVWAAMRGYTALYKRTSASRQLPAFYGAAVALVLVASSIDPSSLHIASGNLAASMIPETVSSVRANLGQAGTVELSAARALAGAVPQGVTISTTESGMPFLYAGRTVRFFPVDIDHADYAVLGARANPDGSFAYSGVVNFLGATELSKIDSVITQRMKRDGYDLRHPVVIAPFGIAVVKRVH